MSLSDLLLSNPPSLSDSLRLETDELRSSIVKANCNTQFAQTAPELADFRHATAGLVDGMDDDVLSETFRKTVHFTTPESYAPFIAKLFEKPRKAGAVVDLLAPGFPDFVVRSSSTSGGTAKHFLRYNILSKIRSSSVKSLMGPGPLQGRTRAYMFHLWCHRMDFEDEGNGPVPEMHLSGGSAVAMRLRLRLDPEKDEEKMGAFVLDHTAPYAAGFIKTWRSFLLIHVLFALASRSLETISMAFISTFVEMMRHLDTEFDMLVDCIAKGTIPDLDGVAEFRHYLEPNIFSDLERAAELRRLGRPSSRSGWCEQAWPNLHEIGAVAGGPFASYLPTAKSFIGPKTNIRTRGYSSSEGWIGSPYNPLELNQFKLDKKNIVEFLDISKGDSITAIAQSWEVEARKRYELLLTTQDGLWRYRLGDVVEISGFHPTDGSPIFQFVERSSMAIRFIGFVIAENELRTAISSVVPRMTVKVVDWTTTMDHRSIPTTVGYFIELAGDPVSDLSFAPESVLEELSRLNQRVAWAVEHHVFGKPTIRLVRPGTFGDFLQLKLDEGSDNIGQIKVPAVLPKDKYVAWFLDRVVQEL